MTDAPAEGHLSSDSQHQWFPRMHADALLGVASSALLRVADAPDPAAKSGRLHAYTAAVQTLLGSGWLTTSQATTLTSLSHAIW